MDFFLFFFFCDTIRDPIRGPICYPIRDLVHDLVHNPVRSDPGFVDAIFSVLLYLHCNSWCMLPTKFFSHWIYGPSVRHEGYKSRGRMRICSTRQSGRTKRKGFSLPLPGKQVVSLQVRFALGQFRPFSRYSFGWVVILELKNLSL